MSTIQIKIKKNKGSRTTTTMFYLKNQNLFKVVFRLCSLGTLMARKHGVDRGGGCGLGIMKSQQ